MSAARMMHTKPASTDKLVWAGGARVGRRTCRRITMGTGRVQLDGKIAIAAPPAEVWALLLDPERLASCVPGVRDVRAVDARTFTGAIGAAVGPLQSDFSFTTVVVRETFPDDLGVEMEGTDAMTKSTLRAEVTITLAEPEPGRTEMRYRATITVKGRLAILGEMILRASAGAMIGEVAKRMRAQLEAAA